MQLNFNRILSRALIAGLATGVAMALYLYAVVEPIIDEAVALEESLAVAGGDDAGEDPLFDRSEQVVGGMAANVVYAVVVASVFGVVFARFRHRLPGGTDLVRAVWLAAVAFGAVALIPGLAYPANPPAVGDPDTVNERTVQYLVVLVVSLASAVALTRLAGALRDRLDGPTRAVAVTAATVALYGTILAVLPDSPDSIAPEVPAALVWEFRVRSLGGLALLWSGLGLGLGWLLEREATASREVTATSGPDPDLAGAP